MMLIIEKILTGTSNVQAWSTPLEKQEKPEEQHQHEFQSWNPWTTTNPQWGTTTAASSTSTASTTRAAILRQQNNCNHQSQPLQDSYTNVGTVSNEKQNIVIFGDSIPKGTNKKIVDQKLFNIKFLYSFLPGGTSRDFFHYIRPTWRVWRPISILQYYMWVLMTAWI